MKPIQSNTVLIRIRFILFSLLFFSGAIRMLAADTLYLDREKAIRLVEGENFSYVVDRNGEYTIDDVIAMDFRTEVSEEDRNEIYEAASVWVKIVIRNVSSGSLCSYLYWEPNGYAYIEEDSFSVIEVKTGQFLPFTARDVQTTDPVLQIVVPANGTRTVYLRIDQTAESFDWFSDLDSNLIESSAWMRDSSDRNWQYGIFFGVLFFIVLYNLIFYFTLRDKSYLMYVFFMAFITIVWANANNFTFRYLFPESLHARLLTININYFSMCLGSVFYLLFTMRYLRTKDLLPRWHVALKIMLIVALLLFVLGVVVYLIWGTQIGFTSITMTTLLFILISMVPASGALCKKYAPAWYFIIGNGVLFVMLFLQMMHILPSDVVFGYVTLVQVGTLVQVSMFSLGLAKRISVIRDDREKAQEESIEQMKVNEELKTKVNRELEQKVSERTAELSEQKKIVEEKNKDILDSITYAKRLQQAILPSEEMWSSALRDSFIFYQPKDIVAGDFYWMERRDNVVFVAAADCTGHGVPGAMVSVVCSNALNRGFKEFGIDDPGRLLDKVRELVLETFSKSADQVKDGMDISLARIDLSTREIVWAGANNPLWYVAGGIVNEIKADKQPIGIADAPLPFTNHRIQLASGDLIYLFTDGFADQFGGPKGKKFKYKPLLELVLSVAPKPMKEQNEILQRTILEWKGPLEQIDDICIVGIRV